MFQIDRSHFNKWLLSFIVFGLGLQVIFGELIPLPDGSLWDSRTYIGQVKQFDFLVQTRGFNSYYVQRFFPSAVIHYLLKWTAIAPTTENIILAFRLLNFSLLLVGIGIWRKIAQGTTLSTESTFIGYCMLFLNYPAFKMSSYHPALTDIPSFVLGLTSLYSYLSNRPLLQIFTGIVGAFTWPTQLIFSLVLFCFPKSEKLSADLGTEKSKAGNFWGIFLGFLLFLNGVWGIWRTYYRIPGWVSDSWTKSSIEVTGLIIFGLYGFFAYRELFRLNAHKLFKLVTAKANLKRMLIALLVFLSTKQLQKLFYTPDAGYITFEKMFVSIGKTATDKPFIFGIAHLLFFSPFLLLLIPFWPSITRMIRKDGLGMFFMVSGSIFFGGFSESRCLINIYPLAVFLIVRSLSKIALSFSNLIQIFIWSIIFSKVWFPLNHFYIAGEDPHKQQRYTEIYFMNQGPWMNWNHYFLGIGILALFSVSFISILRSFRRLSQDD